MNVVERCSSCILTTNLPGIDLDEDGVCRYCREAKSGQSYDQGLQQQKLRKRFETVISRLKGRGKYDCLVPLSGGKESSYILWILVQNYNMKPLAFNFSNGFQHPDAIRNIENLVDRLGIDLVVYRPSLRKLHELMRTFLSKAGEFCTPCNMLISATAFRLARQNGIRAIMSGNAARTGPGLAGVSSATYYDRIYYLNIVKDILSRRDRKYYINPPYIRTVMRRLLGIEAQVINVLDYLNPSLTEIHQTLETIGWSRPAGEIQHGDCMLNSLKEYLYYKRWACTEVTSLYSVLIRNGEIDRQEALKKAQAEEDSKPPKVLPEFLNAIGMTQVEFEQAAKKDFRDIPNIRNRMTFRLVKRLMHSVEQIRGRR
jgi:hypothetical protein